MTKATTEAVTPERVREWLLKAKGRFMTSSLDEYCPQEFIELAEAYLALSSPPMGAKPVAWRVKDYADGWIVYSGEEFARRSDEARNGALVQPLYALAQPGSDGAVAVALLGALARDCLASDFNECWDSYTEAKEFVKALANNPAIREGGRREA